MTTIKIGIDLGTTNSSVAVIQNKEPQIVKNDLGEESTPSVVYGDRAGTILVGSKAKKRANHSKENLKNSRSEIKRLMGTSETLFFPHLNKHLLPEEISAEILKSLTGNVERKYPDMVLDSVVITIPAYFSTVQSEATKRAGILSGFKQVVLLQEPIAAAIAYGFLNQKNTNWLVYDLGGGTFDVALVAARDGLLTILGHAGDNFLGGKDFDTVIVQKLILPSLEKKGVVIDSKAHPQIFSYFKELAETAKIELTISEKTTIDIDTQIDQLHIEHSLAISRLDLLEICKPLLEKTSELCKKTVNDAKVDFSSVQKIVLVGGPTQMPILREFLKDSLQIDVDGSLDPLTVVAQGAAMFGNQTMVSVQQNNVSNDPSTQCQIELNYNPVTSDDDQVITGKILNCSEPRQPQSVQFIASDDSFASEKILIKNGKFMLTLPTGEKGTEYLIHLKDNANQLIVSSCKSIHINRGASIMGAPLPYSIGVSILSASTKQGYFDSSEIMDFFFSKNNILPLKAKKSFRTAVDVKSGASENSLPVCIYEGESLIPNRNTLVCNLAITGKSIAKDLRCGSPVEITLEINESRELFVTAYLPELDLALNARQTLYLDALDINKLKKDLSEEISRFELIREHVEQSNEIILVENMIEEIQATVDQFESDSEQARKAEKQMKDLMMTLDCMEANTKFTTNISKFHETCEEISNYLNYQNGIENSTRFKLEYENLYKEGISAIEGRNAELLYYVIRKLDNLKTRSLMEDACFLNDIIHQCIRELQENKDKNPTIPSLIDKANRDLAKMNVKEKLLFFRELYQFTDQENTKIEFLTSGIMV